jgi:flagellar L-ring protein FlgH
MTNDNRIRNTGLVAGVCAICWSSAFGQTAPQSPTPPVVLPDPALAASVMQRNGGSLMRATLAAAPDPSKTSLMSVSYFAVPVPEPRTMRKHDLVTIIIREESKLSSDGTTELKKSADLDARLQEFLKLNLKNFALEGGAEGDNPPSIKLGGSRNFKGEGKVERDDSFIARITAEVIDVRPNGTVAVQARKLIKTDEEEQEFILTGILRSLDVTPDNTVLSTQIYNLELQKNHKGAVRDTSKRGFIPKIIDAINPF